MEVAAGISESERIGEAAHRLVQLLPERRPAEDRQGEREGHK